MKKIWSVLGGASLVCASFFAHAQMVTPNQSQASQTGAAEQEIPLKATPSDNTGAALPLSLHYSSQGSDGILGKGWNIHGLSSITRCGRTPAQDGAGNRAIPTDEVNDAYCLDGKRLLLSSGTYGAANSEYRLEVGNFERVVASGGGSSGPESFTVWTKAGSILEFGATSDSRVEAQGKTAVRNWLLSRVRDKKGNAVELTYSENNALGSAWIQHIKYKNVGKPVKWAVYFDYEARQSPPLRAYLAGSLTKLDQRLKKIRTYTVSPQGVETPSDNYSMTYALNKDQLIGIQQCTGSTCLPTLSFGYGPEGVLNFKASGSGNWNGPPVAADSTLVMDLDGDGVNDLLSYVSGRDWKACISNRSNVTCSTWTGHAGGLQVSVIGDFNGDGRTDIAGYDQGRSWEMCLSTETSFNCSMWSAHGGGVPKNVTGDFNGDGLTDLAGYDADRRWDVCLSTGSGFNCSNWDGHGGSIEYNVSGDFNGDGMTDLAGYFTNFKWDVCLSTGIGFQCSSRDGHNGGKPHSVAGDFNGDGLTDIAGYYLDHEWAVCLSTGKTFNCETWFAHGGGVPFNVSGDYNGDGRTDLAGYYINDQWVMCLSTGINFSCSTWYGTNNGVQWTLAGDFNGDGATDLASSLTGSNWEVQLSSSPPAGRLTTTSTGLGASATYSYKALTDPAVYTKETATYPQVAVQGPVYVVSKLSVPDGRGGLRHTNYTYSDMKADVTGRGALGFRTIKAVDEATGFETYTEYAQSWPYAGLETLFRVGRAPVMDMQYRTSTYGCKVPEGSATATTCPVAPGNRYFPYLATKVERRKDLAGVLLSDTTTTQQYNAYGDPTQVKVTTPDGYSKTTDNTYLAPDLTNWILGRLQRSKVTSVSP